MYSLYTRDLDLGGIYCFASLLFDGKLQQPFRHFFCSQQTSSVFSLVSSSFCLFSLIFCPVLIQNPKRSEYFREVHKKQGNKVGL